MNGWRGIEQILCCLFVTKSKLAIWYIFNLVKCCSQTSRLQDSLLQTRRADSWLSCPTCSCSVLLRIYAVGVGGAYFDGHTMQPITYEDRWGKCRNCFYPLSSPLFFLFRAARNWSAAPRGNISWVGTQEEWDGRGLPTVQRTQKKKKKSIVRDMSTVAVKPKPCRWSTSSECLAAVS